MIIISAMFVSRWRLSDWCVTLRACCLVGPRCAVHVFIAFTNTHVRTEIRALLVCEWMAERTETRYSRSVYITDSRLTLLSLSLSGRSVTSPHCRHVLAVTTLCTITIRQSL